MERKETSQLCDALMHASNIETYLKNNSDQFSNRDVAELLTELFEIKHITKAELAKRAGISEVYLHQVFAGRRKPSRDRLLCICLGLQATLEETQRLLQQSVYAPLYPKNRRDSIIAYGILHQMEATAINDKLFTEKEETLF